MRRWIILIVAVFLFFGTIQVLSQITTSSGLYSGSQTTATPGVSYGLLFRSPTDARPVKKATGHFRWHNLRGRTELTLGLKDTSSVSVMSRGRPVSAVLTDSTLLDLVYGTTQQVWLLTVMDTVRLGKSHSGSIVLRVSNMLRGGMKDTTLFISPKGLYSPNFIMYNTSVVFAPFDSMKARDQTVLTWITFDWQ